MLCRLMSLWLEDREHLVAFHARPHLDIPNVGYIFFQLLQNSRAQLTVRHLTSAEPNRRFDLVAFRQPLARALHAIAVIMHIGTRTELHFLDRDDDLLLLRFVCLLLLLV